VSVKFYEDKTKARMSLRMFLTAHLSMVFGENFFVATLSVEGCVRRLFFFLKETENQNFLFWLFQL